MNLIAFEDIKKILKEVYLEVANNYSVADLRHDDSKVACVASRFRDLTMRRIEKLLFMNGQESPASQPDPGWEEHIMRRFETVN